MKKYLKTFNITFVILIGLLFLISFIPKKMIYKNVIKSFQYYYKQKKVGYLNNTFLFDDSYKIDYKADMKSLSMAYYINENDKIHSLIRMNYLEQTEGALEDFSKYIINNNGSIIGYGRYWQGQTIFLRPLLILFSIRIIYFIEIALFFIIFILLAILLLKKDKLLGISFIVGNILINFFIIPYCFEYIFSFLISYISCMILLKLIDKKSKNIDLLFLINGILVAFFDFLTCETVTLCLPLFIYIYLNNKKVSYKEILKMIILWVVGYILMFSIKWVIGYIFYGAPFITSTIDFAKKRIYFTNTNIILLNITNIGKIFKQLFFINKFKYGLTLITGIIFYEMYNILFNNKEKLYKKLCLVSMIPIIRFTVLSAHTYVHYYFIYRALLPLLMFIIVYAVNIFKNVKYCKNKID